MKVAFVTAYDPLNPVLHNGSGYYTGVALRQNGIEVDHFGPLTMRHSLRYGVRKAWYRHVFNRAYDRTREPEILKDYARQIERRLKTSDYDVVFSAMSPGSQPVAYLETNKPIVFWTDATFAGVLDFYPEFSNRCQTEANIRNAFANETSALERASLAVYYSEWAARTAMANYDVDPAKLKVVPIGPGLDCNRSASDIRHLVNARRFGKCELLFIGADWHRKGADTAIRVAARLNKAGLKTCLTLVGCRPPAGTEIPEFVKITGYISKRSSEGARQIEGFFANAHFVLVPSRADCTPVIFAEASSFGVPSLSRAIGGIPTMIRSDVNGRTFDRDANPDEYVSFILELMSSPARYRDMALSSFHEYETRLNWNSAGRTMKTLLEELLAGREERCKPGERTVPKDQIVASFAESA
jgi:glycosyltransferase involved in cell wall biosynthesis